MVRLSMTMTVAQMAFDRSSFSRQNIEKIQILSQGMFLGDSKNQET